jgi:sRNA-binding carbon storage regulator CsrA
MLVLSRSRSETVVIDLSDLTTLIKNNPALLQEILSKPIQVINTGRHGLQTKLGFAADPMIKVHRLEVFNRRKGANNGIAESA